MKCPICQNEDLDLLSDRIRSGSGKVYFCKSCDIGVLETDSERSLGEYYSKEYWETHGPDIDKKTDFQEIFDTYVNFQHRRLELMAPYLNPTSRLLEVGCATGHFLFNVKDKVQEAIGVDYATDAAAFAAKVTGCKTYGHGLDKAGLEPASFDIVCAFQTIEHTPNPSEFVTLLSRFLKPGGVLVIEAPSLYDPLLSVYANEAYKPFFYHSEHILYFSEKSLMGIMKECGFSGAMHFVQDYNFMNHMHWLLREEPQPNGRMGLGQASLPLSNSLPKDIHDSFQAWIHQVDLSYKKLLAEHHLSENITFIGKRPITSEME